MNKAIKALEKGHQFSATSLVLDEEAVEDEALPRLAQAQGKAWVPPMAVAALALQSLMENMVLTAAFGGAWLSGGRLKIRFKGATRSEETVTVGGHVQRVQEGHEGRRLWCAVECLNQQGGVLVAGQVEVKL